MTLAIYLDDSSSVESPIITIAGYMAPTSIWQVVEQYLVYVCQVYNVDTLHAKEFYDTKGCFSGWSREKKMRFVGDLYGGPTNQLYGLSFSGSKQLPSVMKEYKFMSSTSLYQAEFARLVGFLLLFHPDRARMHNAGLSFLVEAGHKNNAGIEKWFHRASSQEEYKGALKSLTFVTKDNSRAIQLADFLAFHARRWSAKCARVRNRVVVEKDPVLDKMSRLVYHHFDMISDPEIRRFDTYEQMIDFMKSLPNQVRY